MYKASDYIFEYLVSKGVDTVFSVSGGAAAHLLDSMSRRSEITHVCNYHEQACAMAAEGYARITRKPACVLVTNGPGSSNTITGVLGAFQDSIPMIVISGQVPTHQTMGCAGTNIRQLGVQECDIISMVKTITKYAVQVRDPKTLQYHLEMAYILATTGRQGPVWLDVPLDVQSSSIDVEDSHVLLSPAYTPIVDIDSIIEVIQKSKKPLVVTGNGIHLSETENETLALLRKLNVPVVSTWTSKDLFDHDDPQYVGNFGLFGERAANFAIQSADLLLILGSRLSIANTGYQSQLFAPNAVKIMVDLDENEIKKSTLKIDHPVIMDLRKFIPRMISGVSGIVLPDWSKWLERTQTWKKRYPVFLPEYKSNNYRINSFYFMEVLSGKLQNEVVVTDMGTSYTCTMQSLQMNGKTRLFTSSSCCSMGFGLPGAIGAHFAKSGKPIVLIAGDGGFQMNLQELQTIAHHKLPIKMFILNNNGYSAISAMQNNLFAGQHVGSTLESGVSAPDFVKIAGAYGIKACRFKTNIELKSGIDDVMMEEGPVLCEIMIPENQLLVPRVQSSKTEAGKIISGSLENMYPYLPDAEMKEIFA